MFAAPLPPIYDRPASATIDAASRPVRAAGTVALLCALFGGALAIRTWALAWGLPYVEHPDEPALLEIALRMVRDGDANPHSFIYPSLMFYLLAGVIRLHVWWGIGHGAYASLADIPPTHYQYTATPELFVWARAISATLGAMTVPALYLLGRRMFDARTGLLAAVALTGASFHSAHSHYITADAATGLWVVLALLGAWEVAATGRWRGYLLAGCMAGLAAATKYNAGSVALVLPLAHLLYWRRLRVGRALLRMGACTLVAIAVFCAATPYAVLDVATFLKALRFNELHYAAATHGDFNGRWQLGEYMVFVWREALFPPGCLLLIGGLPLLVRRYPGASGLLLAAVSLGVGLLLPYEVHFVRNLLPIFPVLVLLSAASTLALAGQLRLPAARHIAPAALSAALLALPVHDTLWQLRYWSRPYTMTLAAEQLRALPHGMRAAVEQHPVQWAGDPRVFPGAVTEHTVAWYRSNGFRYMIVNDDYHSGEDQATVAQLIAASTMLAEYPRRRVGVQPGPGGALLDLGEHVAAMRFVRRPMRFEDQLALLGYEIQAGPPRDRITALEGAHQTVIGPGEPLQINMYWRALQRPAVDYTLFVHVVDAAGTTVAQRDLPLRYGDYPSSNWQPGELVIDRADLPLPALPPGQYRLEVGLYDAATGLALRSHAADSTLTTLEVR